MKKLDELTKIQYEVTQNNGTEPPFNNEYYNNFEKRNLCRYYFWKTNVYFC